MYVDVVALWENNIFKRVFFLHNIGKEVFRVEEHVIANAGNISTDKSKKHL